MKRQIDTFEKAILEAGILDPEGAHHILASGKHGRKLDFDAIPRCSDLYRTWVRLNAARLVRDFQPLPEILIGVANGTNRLAIDVGQYLGRSVLGLTSAKEEGSKQIILPESTRNAIGMLRPAKVVVLEDVGTTGGNAAQVADLALAAGAVDVEVLITWQRQNALPALDERAIAYSSLIKHVLPTYDPSECARAGYCAEGWDLV